MSKSKCESLIKILAGAAWQAALLGRGGLPPMRKLSNKATDENEDLSKMSSEDKFTKYWPTNNKSIPEILEEADKLYENKEYMDVYEMLNRLKYHNNSEVKWRIARVLYQTTVENQLDADVEREIFAEAYYMLLEEATMDNTNSNIHKWFAIICDCHHRLQGLEKRIEGYYKVLEHLRKSHDLNPDDPSVCYLLGKLCFDMASLKGFKRLVAKILYAEPPECTFEEAYKYLCRVEQLNEKHHIINIYLLGQTCYELKQFYKAKYYLGLVCCLTPRTEHDKKYLCKAKRFMAKLGKYTLGKELLVECNCQNGNDINTSYNVEQKSENQVNHDSENEKVSEKLDEENT